MVPTGIGVPLAGLHATRGAGSARSVAVGAVYRSVAPAGSAVVTVWSAGIPTSVGSVVSTTLTRKDPLSVDRPLSVTEHSTVVVPRGKVDPDAGVHPGVGGVASSASVALAVHETAAPAGDVASTTWSPGRWSTGGVLATTSTMNVMIERLVRPDPVRDQMTVKLRSVPPVDGIVSETVDGAFEPSFGEPSDGQSSNGPGQPAGTGPIVVEVADAAPSPGTVTEVSASVTVEPTGAWLKPAQVNVKLTGQVTTWPGPAWPRSTVVWLPSVTASPSAGIVSA